MTGVEVGAICAVMGILCGIVAIVSGVISEMKKNIKSTKLNETVDIKEDSIKLTVLGSEKFTINRPALEIDGFSMENSSNGDYIKVKISIENYGMDPYLFSATTFYLGKEPISLVTMSKPRRTDYE